MVDFDKVPKSIYDDLVRLLGESKAEEYVKSVGYDFNSINTKILSIQLIRFVKKRFYEIIMVLIGLGIFLFWS